MSCRNKKENEISNISGRNAEIEDSKQNSGAFKNFFQLFQDPSDLTTNKYCDNLLQSLPENLSALEIFLAGCKTNFGVKMALQSFLYEAHCNMRFLRKEGTCKNGI